MIHPTNAFSFPRVRTPNRYVSPDIGSIDRSTAEGAHLWLRMTKVELRTMGHRAELSAKTAHTQLRVVRE